MTGVRKLRHEPDDTYRCKCEDLAPHSQPSYLPAVKLVHLYQEPTLDTEENYDIRDFTHTMPPQAM